MGLTTDLLVLLILALVLTHVKLLNHGFIDRTSLLLLMNIGLIAAGPYSDAFP